jgi:hypothetical protein
LKVCYDEPPSTFAFKSNLRRYTAERRLHSDEETETETQRGGGDSEGGGGGNGSAAGSTLGRAAQVDPIKPTMKAPVTKRLKLKYDEPLSNLALNFTLRRHSSAKR